MTRSFVNSNLLLIFNVVKPEQCLVNILFDEVKLLKTTRLACGHIIGYATNATKEVATLPFVSKLFAITEDHVL